MKDNYSEMNVDMEQILLNKNYDDLTATELDEIKDFVSSKEEFIIMKSTLMNVKTSFGVEEEIVPVDSAKQNLMKMFEQKHGKVIPMNKPRPFYLNPVFQIGIAALFILGIIYFYPKAENESLTAMNESKEESASESKDMETTEGKEESPAEETMVTEELENAKTEEDLAEENIPMKSTEKLDAKEVLEDVPAFAKADVEKPVSPKTSANELAKGEGSDKYLDKEKESNELLELEATVYRSSTKKEKAKDKKVTNDNSVDGVTTTGTTAAFPTNTAVTGGIVAADEVASVGRSEEKADDDHKDSGKNNRTNSAGGYYMQPGKPASDLKEGVSLKDEPALSEFLFTAL
jgi:hypothetical protein